MKSSHQQQQPPQLPVIPLPPNSQLLKLVLCFFLSTFAFGCGIIFSSNIQTSPVISLETIKLYLPSTLLPPPPPPPPPPQHKTPPSPPPPPPPPPPPQSKQPHLGLKDHVKPKILMRPRSPPPPLMKKSHLGPKHHVEPKVLMPPRSPPPPLLKKSKDYVEQKVLMHHMKDDQLLKMASMVPKVGGDAYKGRTPKVAFMFLIKGELPFAPIWEKFFKGHQGLYSIYLHMDPSYNRSTPKDSVFYGRRVPSKPVHWGRVDMMEAERRLLANALLDYNNQRFVLLSESCVPIFNFSTVYSYLINSTQTFVQVIDELGATGRGRYSIKMLPQITQEQWRKGSQWFEIDREIAIAVVSDKIYFPVFRKYCKGTCYTDEHYLPTLVHMHFPYKNANRSLTWVDWSRGGPHPLRYARTMVTVDLLKEIRGGSSCVYNGEETSMCHMFARKFLPNALTRFEMFSRSIMGFG